ncbi:TonB-dependent siderophore receptor [Methylomonas sp. AM2-LC]|uniref:TonB-dependent receptor n=1 Tax=Methylomonas sp. AM2-LC TaxID=3153301 RepID=UPI003267132D
MPIRSYPHNKSRKTHLVNTPSQFIGATVFGIAASSTWSQVAKADNDSVLPEVNVEASSTTNDNNNLRKLNLDLYSAPIQDTPQAIDVIDKEQLQNQSITRLQDALKNVAGITMNSGEGGAHGDNVNLRGLVVQNGFFMDGLRDPGNYTRDSFNLESVDVIKGSSSVMFGYGSTAGVVNQESKMPTQTTLRSFAVKGGTNALARITGDFNEVINPGTAVRLALMAERSNIADRDIALNRRYGFAPSISFGMDGPTRLTLSYLHQEENNIPDYGIPILWGSVAPVARNKFYGLANYDRTQTDTNVLTASFEHAFNSKTKFTNTFRYGSYDFNYQVTSPTLGDNPPSIGTALDQILVYRDQPSSAGYTTLFADRMNLTTQFNTGQFKHDLVTGLGLSRESMSTTRYANQIDQITPTSLLNPNPQQVLSIQSQIAAQPGSRGDDINLYTVDTLHVTEQWDVMAGLNFDRFISKFYDSQSGNSFTENNSLLSPRAALVFKPFDTQSYYFSYGTSYNPAIQYLTLAPSTTSLTPQKTTNLELGGKLSLLNGKLSLNGALFQLQADNLRVADPNDPTLQAVTFGERVRGLELTLNGRITQNWEINTGYTHLNALIVNGINTDTGLSEVGNKVPNVASDTYNLWTTYTPTDSWKVGSGVYVYGPRYASPDNSARMAGYALWNMMTSYQIDKHFNVQLNLDNVTNKYYLQSAYYSSSSESHAVPGPGRTGYLTLNVSF